MTKEIGVVNAFWRAVKDGDAHQQIALARRLLHAGTPLRSEAGHSALCVLLNDANEVEYVKNLIEQALAEDFDRNYPLLLPLLGHAYQRNFDLPAAHLVFSTCAQLRLLSGLNHWAVAEANSVRCALAEDFFYKKFDGANYAEASVQTRMLYELHLKLSAGKGGRPSHGNSGSFKKRTPDFIIIGSAKCGTTYLYDLLARSPSVWNRTPKEIHYFTNLYGYSPSFYFRFFSACPKNLKCGESSPDYFDCTNPALHNYVDVAGRIRKHLPNTRIVVLLRDPALRAISLYNQMITNERSLGPRPGSEQLLDLTFKDIEEYRSGYVLKSGHYITPLRRFVDVFGRDRILILTTEGLYDIVGLFERLAPFLEISPPTVNSLASIERNKGSHETPTSHLYHQLRDYYAASLGELAGTFGVKL